jgi:hypothetical protein
MELELLRDNSKKFPKIENPLDIQELTIWYCKYKSLLEIGAMTNLKKLVIAGFPNNNLDVLTNFKALKKLKILHMPKVTNLSPLESLTELESLSLSTQPSWDVSGKKTIVDSLLPISSLAKLENLELLGIVPLSGSLKDIYNLSSIKKARFSQYSIIEIDRFYANTGAVKASESRSE